MHKFLGASHRVVYSIKTVKAVLYYDQDKTYSPRDYLTPGIIAYPVMSVSKPFVTRIAPDRRQSKILIVTTNVDQKWLEKSVFDCHLSPVGRQIAIENSVFNYFDLRSSIG